MLTSRMEEVIRVINILTHIVKQKGYINPFLIPPLQAKIAPGWACSRRCEVLQVSHCSITKLCKT